MGKIVSVSAFTVEATIIVGVSNSEVTSVLVCIKVFELLMLDITKRAGEPSPTRGWRVA